MRNKNERERERDYIYICTYIYVEERSGEMKRQGSGEEGARKRKPRAS